jgi:hypothetical protein
VALLGLHRLNRAPAGGLSGDTAELLRQLRRLGIEPAAGETLEQLTRRAAAAWPELADALAQLAACHGERHYAAGNGHHTQQHWQLALRKVKRWRGSAISRGTGSSP